MQILRTEDYSLFKRIKGNRAPNKAHIRRLKQAISENAEMVQYTPIVVNKNYEIIDGQHRAVVNQELGLPIYYIQGDDLGLKNVQDLNSMNKPWTPKDFAYSYSELGNKHYAAYIDFKNKYHLNHDVLLAYLGLDNPITSTMFKVGKLKVQDVQKSHELCKKLLELGEVYPRYNKRAFALAFKRMWQNPLYNHERLLSKMRGSKLQDYALPEDYIRAMEKIYNSRVPVADRVRFY